MQIPFLSAEAIEHHAEKTRTEALAAGVAATFPFDVESTVEFLFGFSLDFDADLPRGVLGHVDAARRMICVSGQVRHDGQRRFTVAHEVGHLVLHIPLLLAHQAQPRLFDLPRLPYGDRNMEVQANSFASALLMPQQAMLESFGTQAAQGEWVDVHHVVDTFGVSYQAAEIRLKTLGMLTSHAPGPRLQM